MDEKTKKMIVPLVIGLLIGALLGIFIANSGLLGEGIFTKSTFVAPPTVDPTWFNMPKCLTDCGCEKTGENTWKCSGAAADCYRANCKLKGSTVTVELYSTTSTGTSSK